MTTFVDTSVLLPSEQDARDHDPAVVVVRSAHGLLKEGLGEAACAEFEKNFASVYSAENWSGVFDLLLSNAPVIFKKLAATEEASAGVVSLDALSRVTKTAEGYFEVTLSVLMKLGSVEEVAERMAAFSTVMLEDSVSVAVLSLKLRLLTTLLNLFSPKTSLRLQVVTALCKFASLNEKPSFHCKAAIWLLVKDVDRWMDFMTPEVEDETRFEVLASVKLVCPTVREKIKVLALQGAIPTKESLVATELAVECIRDAAVYDFSQMSSLCSFASDVTVRKCLDLLIGGNFAEMKEFIGTKEALAMAAAYTIVLDQLLDKMRVLCLPSLVSNNVILLSAVSERLGSSDPIGLVVAALRHGIIRGSINEVEGVVQVTAVRPKNTHGLIQELGQIIENLKKE